LSLSQTELSHIFDWVLGYGNRLEIKSENLQRFLAGEFKPSLGVLYTLGCIFKRDHWPLLERILDKMQFCVIGSDGDQEFPFESVFDTMRKKKAKGIRCVLGVSKRYGLSNPLTDLRFDLYKPGIFQICVCVCVCVF